MNRKSYLLRPVLAANALTGPVPAVAAVDPNAGAERFILTPSAWLPNLS